jgi:excinuclease ABC subunit B
VRQAEYNEANGIEPATVRRLWSDLIDVLRPAVEAGDNAVREGRAVLAPVELAGMPPAEVERLLTLMREEMHAAATALAFEDAARLRDEIVDLEQAATRDRI